ncbi:energy-coupling factor transporter transmembrane protein EcfT [Mycoplasmatota bacterium]|nr:energy-coupling factor transporter transmembrane protein EcfT [Mycoplasmatota bacterium]
MQIVIGQYIPTNSWIHRLDPRSKLISLILLIGTTFVIGELYTMAGLLLFTVILIKSSKIPISRFLKGIAPLVFLLFFTVIFQILFNQRGELLYSVSLSLTWLNIIVMVLLIVGYNLIKKKIKRRFLFFLMIVGLMIYSMTFAYGGMIKAFNVNVHSEGLTFAGFLITRILILVSLSSLLTLTTKPTELNNGLESVLKPLKIIKVPTEEISMMISIALRFIPTLLDEANKIIKAQASRGVDFKEGTLKQKVVQIIALLIPMFIISFKRADDLANAMEARGYFPGKTRSKLIEFKFSYADYIILIITISLIPSVVYFGL